MASSASDTESSGVCGNWILASASRMLFIRVPRLHSKLRLRERVEHHGCLRAPGVCASTTITVPGGVNERPRGRVVNFAIRGTTRDQAEDIRSIDRRGPHRTGRVEARMADDAPE